MEYRVGSPMPVGSDKLKPGVVSPNARTTEGSDDLSIFLGHGDRWCNKALPTTLAHGPWYFLLVVSRS